MVVEMCSLKESLRLVPLHRQPEHPEEGDGQPTERPPAVAAAEMILGMGRENERL